MATTMAVIVATKAVKVMAMVVMQCHCTHPSLVTGHAVRLREGGEVPHGDASIDTTRNQEGGAAAAATAATAAAEGAARHALVMAPKGVACHDRRRRRRVLTLTMVMVMVAVAAPRGAGHRSRCGHATTSGSGAA